MDTVFTVYGAVFNGDKVIALTFIMPSLGNRSGGASFYTGATRAVNVKQAICVQACGCPRTNRQIHIGDDTPATVGNTPLRDKSVGQAESAEAGNVGNMSL